MHPAADGGTIADDDGSEGSRPDDRGMLSPPAVAQLRTVLGGAPYDVLAYYRGDADPVAYVIPVAPLLVEDGSAADRFLIAVPPRLYGRKLADRLIPTELVAHSDNVRSAAVVIEDLAALEGDLQDLEKTEIQLLVLDVQESFFRTCALAETLEDDSVIFRDKRNRIAFPTAPELIARVKFLKRYQDGFVTAHSSDDGGRRRRPAPIAPSPAATPGGLEDRMLRLELGLSAILSRMGAEDTVGQPVPLQAAPAAAKATLLAPKAKAAAASTQETPGDRALVAEAAQAGIPEDQVRTIMQLLRKPHGRLQDEPRRRQRSPSTNVLGETDPVDDAARHLRGTEPLDSRADLEGLPPVERAVLELTALTRHLVSGKTPRGTEPLDKLLDGYLVSGGVTEQTAVRRGAAALRALRRTLTEDPDQISRPIRERMARMNRTVADEASGALADSSSSSRPPDPLFWLEHRSQVTLHKPTVQWGWIVGNILKCLLDGKKAEAEARCYLALAAADQLSLDTGSWTVAWELQLMEDDPPWHSFANRAQVPSTTRLPVSRLIDERWLDAIVNRLKEVDEAIERRRKIDGKAPRPAATPTAAAASTTPTADQDTSKRGPKGGKGKKEQPTGGAPSGPN